MKWFTVHGQIVHELEDRIQAEDSTEAAEIMTKVWDLLSPCDMDFPVGIHITKVEEWEEK